MKVIVAGAGKMGRYLAEDLARRGHHITLIDKDPDTLDGPSPGDLSRLAGDACSPDVLEQAGARAADAVVAATGDDEDNLVVSLLAKQEFAVPRVLARVNHPTNEWLFDDSWGVDVAVSPPHLLTALVEEDVTEGDLVDLLRLERGAVHLMEVRLGETSNAAGRRVEELGLPPDIVLVAAVRDGHVVACRPSTPLAEGDEVIALVPAGRQDELRDLIIGS